VKSATFAQKDSIADLYMGLTITPDAAWAGDCGGRKVVSSGERMPPGRRGGPPCARLRFQSIESDWAKNDRKTIEK
jgi:hypothetical protein